MRRGKPLLGFKGKEKTLIHCVVWSPLPVPSYLSSQVLTEALTFLSCLPGSVLPAACSSCSSASDCLPVQYLHSCDASWSSMLTCSQLYLTRQHRKTGVDMALSKELKSINSLSAPFYPESRHKGLFHVRTHEWVLYRFSTQVWMEKWLPGDSKSKKGKEWAGVVLFPRTDQAVLLNPQELINSAC